MNKLSVRILGGLAFMAGGFVFGFELFGKYGGIAGTVIAFLITSLYLWKQQEKM